VLIIRFEPGAICEVIQKKKDVSQRLWRPLFSSYHIVHNKCVNRVNYDFIL